MKKMWILGVVITSLFTLSTALVSAQTNLSQGCASLVQATGSADASLTAIFAEGETITITVVSADSGLFDVSIAGNLLLDDADTGSTTMLTVPADGEVAIEITVTVGTGTYRISCTPAEMEEEPVFDGTLCHRPPGNPSAAHTITVGSENAVQTHIEKHGDTLGACSEEVQTRADSPDLDVTVFVIYETDTIQVYGDCSEACEEVINTPIPLIINLNLVVINLSDDGDATNDNFVYVDNPEDYGFMLGEAENEGFYVVIYYLHPDPQNTSVGVFQINVYENNTLVDDNILVFINSNGDIIQWTNQNYWEEQLQESFETGS